MFYLPTTDLFAIISQTAHKVFQHLQEYFFLRTILLKECFFLSKFSTNYFEGD